METLYQQIKARAEAIGRIEMFETDLTWHDRHALGSGIASDMNEENRLFYQRRPYQPVPPGSVAIWGVRNTGTWLMIFRPDDHKDPDAQRIMKDCLSVIDTDRHYHEAHDWHVLTVTGATKGGALLGSVRPIPAEEAREIVRRAFVPHDYEDIA